MASPSVVNRATYTNSTAGTTQAVTLPASLVSGNLLLMFLSVGGTPTITTPTGWTQLYKTASGASTLGACFYKTSDGTEGATVSVTTSSSKAVGVTYQISGWSGTPEAGTAATGTSAAPDSPSLSPSWGSADQLFIAAGHSNGAATTSVFPTSYTNGQAANTTAAGAAQACTAERQITAASDNPSAFTISIISVWLAQTVAIRPAGAAEIGRSTPRFLRPNQGPTRGLTRPRAFPPDPNIPVLEVGKRSPNLFRPYQRPTRGLTRPRAFPPDITGATTPQAVSAASATAVTLGPTTVGKIASVASTSATSLLRAMAKTVTVTSTGAISVAKAVAHAITVTSVSVVSVLKSAGKIVAAASTSAASIQKSAGKVISTASTSATSLLKVVGRSILVTASSATSLLKAVGFTRLITSATSASFIKGVGKSIAAAASTAVSVIASTAGGATAVAISVGASTSVALSRQIGKIAGAAVTAAQSVVAASKSLRSMLFRNGGGGPTIWKGRKR